MIQLIWAVVAEWIWPLHIRLSIQKLIEIDSTDEIANISFVAFVMRSIIKYDRQQRAYKSH